MQRFFIIVTGWNCEQYVEKCVDSIRTQICPNWDAFIQFVSDGSTDNTPNEITRVLGCQYTPHEGNYGAAYRRHEALKYSEPEDVIIFMGLDDELLPGALKRIAQEYDNGKLMTYGNWINQDGNGLPSDFDLEFPDSVHSDRSYRKVKYRSTAPNTFKRFLYDCIKPEDLQYKGEWFKATTESEVMFSCLEQCGKDRIGVIKEPIYLYNQGREQNARRRFGIDYQSKIYNYVINKPKRELWSDSK
jgi:glycosyltransferase involved in cell wall biosynthesis